MCTPFFTISICPKKERDDFDVATGVNMVLLHL